MAIKRSPKKWTRLFSLYKKSGLTQRGFCEENGVSLSSFQQALYRRRRNGLGQTAPKAKPKRSKVPAFVEVESASVTEETPVKCASPGLQVEITRAVLTFDTPVDPDYLARLLRSADGGQ